MSNIPPQTRAVDPYASYDSSSVNRLTRTVTDGMNGLSNSYPIDVIIDSTSSVTLKQGILFKDDVVTQLSGDFIVNFSDVSFYRTPSAFNEAGYYYVIAEYAYSKSRPAPMTSILILKPSERAAFNYSQHVMLKIVHVSYTGSHFIIDAVFDYDPENIGNKIIWTKTYPSKEAYLPAFDVNYDIGKISVDRRNGVFYIGTIDGWRELGVFDSPCNTALCQNGDAVYIDSTNFAHPAIATALETLAFGFVVRVGDDTSGVVRFTGRFTGGRLQSGITPAPGEFLYLSDTEAGTVTNTAPTLITSYAQPIGRCIDSTGSYFETILTYLGATIKTIPHNTLLLLQGGSSSERYHLTSSDCNHVVNQDFTHNNLTSKQGGDGTHFYHISDIAFSNLGDGRHNSLAGLQGGDSTNRYHLDLVNYNHVLNQDFDHSNFSNVQGGGEYHLSYSQYIGLTSFTPGTRMLFAQAAAPTGWTQVTSINDRVIRVVSGTGGATGGSWTITGLTSSHNHTISVAGTAITIDQMPAHHHTESGHSGYGVEGGSDDVGAQIIINTGDTGGNQQHTHSASSDTVTPAINADGNWRPAYLDVIIAQKS